MKLQIFNFTLIFAINVQYRTEEYYEAKCAKGIPPQPPVSELKKNHKKMFLRLVKIELSITFSYMYEGPIAFL